MLPIKYGFLLHKNPDDTFGELALDAQTSIWNARGTHLSLYRDVLKKRLPNTFINPVEFSQYESRARLAGPVDIGPLLDIAANMIVFHALDPTDWARNSLAKRIQRGPSPTRKMQVAIFRSRILALQSASEKVATIMEKSNDKNKEDGKELVLKELEKEINWQVTLLDTLFAVALGFQGVRKVEEIT